MNTSINDLFYGNATYDVSAAQAYQDVWLCDRDEEAKARVEANANAALYTMPGMKDTKGMALWARDYARMVSPHLAENPMELVEATMKGMKDKGMQERYAQEFQQLQASGKDYADDYYAMYARMNRDVQQKGWDDHQARVKAVEASLGKVYEYASGADLGQGEGAALTQEDADNMRSVLAAGKMAELDDMRAFSRVYLRKLEQMEDGEAIIRGLDDLEDELLDIVGQDEEKAEMMYRVIMDWGQRVADSDKVSVGDEFLLSLGDKLRTWGQPRTQAMFATTPAVGAAGAINVGALSSAATQIQEAGKEGQDKAMARGILRAGAQKAREVGENTGWVKGALRATVRMGSDTSPFLVPGLGIALGPLDLAASNITDTYDMARASGETRFGAGVQAAIGAAVGPAVELLPFGKIGGVGLSRFTKYLTQVAPGAGSKVGSLARAVGRWQHKNVWRALGAEAGAGFVGEALVEPIASGVLSYGLENTIYALGAPEGEQSRAFAKHFEELAAIWTDSTQLAGLALFTAALTGGSYRGIKANVKNRNVLFASGLTEEQVEQVMESDRPIETANSILEREMETDPEGLWERRAKQSQQLKDEGKVLFLTGAVAQAEVPELQLAYAAAWQEFTDKGILPSVTENEDGTFHVVQKGRYGEKDLDMTLTADAADAFVADAIRQFEDRELKMRQQELGKKAEMPNLRGALQENVATIAGEAMARRTQEQGRFHVEEVAKQVPESIGRMIRANGSINRTIAERITDWAQGEIQALVAGGMDYKAAAASRDYAAGAVRSLGDWTSFAAGFTERAGQVGDVNALVTTLFRSQTRDEVLVDGARVLGSALFGVRGRMSGLNVLEDVTESVLDQMVQARAVHMVEQDSTMSRQEAEAKAWDELGEVVSRARAAVLKADPKAEVVEVKPGNKMSVIEAFSDISNSAFLSSGVVPKWMVPMVETMKANVTAANAAMTLAEAWNAAIEQDPNAVAAMRDILDKVGVEVGEVLADTTITAADVAAWKTARAVARADAYGPNGSGGDAVSEVVAEAEAEEAAILEAEKPASKEAVEEAKEEVRLQEEHAEQVFQPEPGAQVEEPDEVKGVFVGGYCVYNAAGGYYMGLVDKSQLRDGIEQVKVGAKGKHGVIAGRELVGNFQSSAAPLYVWKRTNGELWLISGRHRFELMLRDNGVTSHPCYVFVEDAEHDEKWARMMDYENNMRDDQADEVTAAMYVRETGYSDAELLKRGLLRNASRSKRGALIGRHAREELWTRFTNGAIKPMDAEIICNLTKNIKNQSRVEEIQRRCCMLLAEGKSWDFIGGMVQLMANKESITLKQGLLDLGADFEADLARAAAWIEKSLGKIKESISLLKQGRKLSGKKREEAERLGIVTATQEGAEEMLRDLEMLRGKYEMIGSYPDLVAQAQMWDGKTEVDPVGLYLERVQAEREQAKAEGELDADAYLAEQARKAAAEAVPTLSFSMTPEMESIKVEAVAAGTFMKAPNGEATNLTERQWLQVRTKAFKEWFGDWDGAADLTITSENGNYAAAKEYAKSLSGNALKNEDSGIVAYVNSEQRKELTHQSKARISQGNGFTVNGHYAVVMRIDKVFKRALYCGLYPDLKHNDPNVRIHRFASPIKIDGELGIAWMTAKETLNQEKSGRLYNLELLEINKLAGKVGDIEEHNLLLPPAASKEIIARVKALSKTYFENVSKVVDENGEPMVVYHGTENPVPFSVFKRGKSGYLGPGIYFTPELRTARNYLGFDAPEDGVLYRCFVNMRNPLKISYADRPAKVILDIVSTTAYEKRTAQQGNESKLLRKSDLAKVQSKGYDGIVWLPKTAYEADSYTSGEMLLFDSAQIKSATDNLGTFDGSNPDITFSMSEAKEAGLFKDGVLEASNAVVVEPGVSFSVEARQATPTAGIRKLSTKYIGRGEGNASFGWGLYFSTNEGVHSFYRNKMYNKRDEYVYKKHKAIDDWSRLGRYQNREIKNLNGRIELADAFLQDYQKKFTKETGFTRFETISINWGKIRDMVLDLSRGDMRLLQKMRSEIDRKKRLIAHAKENLKSLREEINHLEKIANTPKRDKSVSAEEKQQAHNKLYALRSEKYNIENARKERHQIAYEEKVIAFWERNAEDVAKKIQYTHIDSPASELEVILNVDAKDPEKLLYWDEAILDEQRQRILDYCKGRRKQIYKDAAAILKENPKIKVSRFYKELQYKNNAKAVSEMLGDCGFAGLYYLDQPSRGATKNITYNYVMWDESAVKVTRYNDAGAGWEDYVDPTASFSVVGEKAANWEEIKHLAFKGRDDGKLRVELDASGAKLKEGEHGQDAKVLAPRFRALVGFTRKIINDNGRWNAVVADWKENVPSVDSWEEVKLVRRLLEKAGIKYKSLGALIDSGILLAVLEPTDERMGAFLEKVEGLDSVSGFDRLGDVLDFPELYKAYPQLRNVPVLWEKEAKNRGLTGISQATGDVWITVRDGEDAEHTLSTLLHETQHVIQFIEGFAIGGASQFADMRRWMADNGYLDEALRLTNAELYHRLAGEIEARNVQKRAGWDAKTRQYYIPFNDTLEYPGLAIVVRAEDLGYPEVTFSMERKRDLTLDGASASKEEAWAYLEQLEWKPLENMRSGFVALVNKPQRKELTDLDKAFKSASNGFSSGAHYAAVCRLDKLFRYAVPCGEYPDLKHGEKSVHIHRFACPLMIDGERAVAWMTAKQTLNVPGSERLYNLELVDIEKLAGNSEYLASHRLDTTLPAASKDIVAQVEEAFKTYFESVPQNVSMSMSEVAQNALLLLESRRDELEAQVILEDMQKACERLSIVLAGDDDPKVGNGLQVYAEMQALISATRRALPEKYLRQGNLNGLLAWAGVYARMAQTGQMPKRGAIKGEIYDRFVRELSKKNELMQLQGMSEAEAREVLMDLGSGKLETAFLKVGRDCAQRLDAFLKDRALERINWLYKMAYPKREEGQAWTRGKMASDAYRLVEKVMAIIGRSHEQRAKVDEEIREVRREQRKIRQAMEDGQMPEDMGKRKLDVLRGRIDRLEAEAMAAAADEHAKLLEELNRQVEELEDGEQKEEQESRLAEEIALVQTFGNWYYKGAGEAVRAARVFEDIVMRGKADWENKLKLERERRAYLKAKITANFTVADKDVENVRASDRAALKGKMGSKAKALGKGLMSMGHLLLALRKKMGRDFCDEQRAKLARINEGFMAFNMELDGWMYRTIRDITGIDTKERQKVWMNQMEEIKDTGIFITNRRTEKIVLTYAEAVAWLNMDKEARALERERVMAEAAQEKRKPQNVPTEEVMDELGELVQAYEKDKRGVEEDRKKFHLTHEVIWEEELRTTKGVLLFYLLTFEQPDYEHLMEVNGVSGATLDQMRQYIGPQMMKWGYAMREKLNEHGVLVADAFESYTGIPFGSRELYFKGVFDRGPMKERDEKAALEQGSAAAGTRTKYGSLIPRRYHKARVERVSATQVFVQAMQQQNNYVQTAEYVREWRGLLSDKEFAKRLEAELGAATMQLLNGCIVMLEGAAAGDAAAARAASGFISRMAGGYAITRLAGNVKSIVKQGSAIMNGFVGGYVPETVVRDGKLVQELAYRKIGFGEFMISLGRVFTFRGAVKKHMVTSQAYIAGRRDYEGKGLAVTAHMEADQKVAGYVPEGGFLGWKKIPLQFWSWLGARCAKATEVAMEAMGYVDSEMCALSAMALADAVYRQGKAEDKAGMVPDELLRAEALRIAGMALDIAAQPQVRTQKMYWASSGAFGALGQLFYQFRSDSMNKVGLWGAQMTSGEKLPAAQGSFTFGLLNAVIYELLLLLYGDIPDDEEELSEHALTFALNVLLGDVTSLPVVGEAVGTVRNMIEGKHWAAQGGIGEVVVPVVTLGSDIYREWKNIDKDAPAEKHWATIARLLRSLGATAAFYHESTTGALANMSSVAAAAAVAGNLSVLFKGILKAIDDLED